MITRRFLAAAVLAAGLIGFPATAFAHEGHDHGGKTKQTQTGPHGGTTHSVSGSWVEIVFRPDAVWVFLYDAKGRAISSRGIRGRIGMKVQGNPRVYRYTLLPAAGRSAPPNAMSLSVDLSKIPDEAMQVSVDLTGLPGTRTAAGFEVGFRVTRTADELAIASQRLCPVSGKKLGSMGRPIKTIVNGKPVYVCCKGCTNALKANPQKYFARLASFTPMPLRATKADAAAIARQKMCPVMDEKLGSMGKPWKVRVNGQDVYVCCKGCIKFLQKNPKKYLAKIPPPLPVKATKADAAAIARQKMCPVMDEKLNAMGGPWKVFVKGRPIFVCCKGCIKKVQQNPDLYIAKTKRLSSQGSPSRR
ncbi:MAG: hypothetical protein ACE5KM_16750 [Planctomycetaceae bacterium]